jgi:hypothetical protein
VLLKVCFLHLDNGMSSALGIILCFDGQGLKTISMRLWCPLFGAFWSCPKAMNLPFLEIIRAI